MKLTAFFLLAVSLHLSAGVASQTVTFSAKRVPLEKVFAEIEKQTGFLVVFNYDLISQAKPVSVNADKMPLDRLLVNILQKQGLDYTINKTTITIRIKKVFTVPGERSGIDIADFQTITGVVANAETKERLTGASIKIKGSKTAVISDGNGHFSLNANMDDILVISYVGFISKEVKIASADLGIVLLEFAQKELEVTVVKGYYTTTKALNTGNVSSVKSTDISLQPVTDPLAVLQGVVPGLFIQQRSGAPGREFVVRLRGQNSIANGNDPLYVVDGIPFNSTPMSTGKINQGAGGAPSPLNDLNPADIDRIEILKDADATAIYGSRGANGVILITTKKGKAGKTEATFNAYTGIGKVTRMLDLMNTGQYLAMRKEAFLNDRLNPGSTDYDLTTWDPDRYTDWQKVLIGGSAKSMDLQAALSGGSNATQFRIAAGMHKENTVFPGDQNNRKISSQWSLNHSSDDRKFQANFSGSFVNNNNRLPTVDMINYIGLAPNAPELYDANGNLNWANSTWQNPMSETLQRYKENINNLLGNLSLSYQILPSLLFKTTFGFNKAQFEQSRIVPLSTLNPVSNRDPATRRLHDYSTNTITTWISEPQLSYSRSVWKGKLDILGGATLQETRQNILTISASGFSSDDLLDNISSGSTITLRESPNSQYRYIAFYGRMGYTLADKYIINFTGRRDGSSRFGPGRQFGNFGAVGAAWLFGRERFIADNLPVISFGKLRASVGTTGNDKLGDYKYISTFTSYAPSYQGISGLNPTSLTNPYFSWERVDKLEASLNLGFFKDDIMLNTTWYRNRTRNQLVGYSLPDITGFPSIQGNLPAVIENTGWEFELTTNNYSRKNFSWTTSANLSIPRNKLVSYPKIEASSYATTYAVGYPLAVRFMYMSTGQDPATGLYTFQDLNNDSKITSAADRKPTFIGQDFFGGLTNKIKYRNWQLDILLTFVKQTAQGYLYDQMPGVFDATSGKGNQLVNAKAYTGNQSFSQDYGNKMYAQNQLFLNSNGIIVDASYLRVRNIGLSWSIPEKWRGRSFIRNSQIYIHCQNMFTITGFKGLDPEVSRYGTLTLPPLRIVTAGMQISL